MTAKPDISATDAARKGEPEKTPKPDAAQPEVGGQKGPEPTRYGDWEKNGIISDF